MFTLHTRMYWRGRRCPRVSTEKSDKEKYLEHNFNNIVTIVRFLTAVIGIA